MAIYISKNNQRLGPFEESAVGDFVRSGAFSPYDLACYEGTNNWQPIHALLPYLNQSQSQQQTWVSQSSLPANSKSGFMTPALLG
ncbi:MAG: DUF4339 domain-containing protein, partial [Acidobacteria bacterium]|nr:DUF4339 domain-containing protein [Acidobacteriota bacterium]